MNMAVLTPHESVQNRKDRALEFVSSEFPQSFRIILSDTNDMLVTCVHEPTTHRMVWDTIDRFLTQVKSNRLLWQLLLGWQVLAFYVSQLQLIGIVENFWKKKKLNQRNL
jgi:hypothetical protein